jgi:hypothetical protein
MRAKLNAHKGLGVVLSVGLALVATPVLAQPGTVARPDMITPDAEKAILAGLQFLAKTQSRDGSWRTNAGYGAYPCAMTALAGFALMAGGNTQVEGPYSANVRQAVNYVLNCATPVGNGVLISKMDEEQRPMYGHGFGMLFLAQAYGMERNPAQRDRIRKVLTRAIVLTGQAQSREGGWLYGPNDQGDEGSVTVTQIQGLRACRNAGIKVPKEVIDRACKYIEKCANADGGISYSYSSRGSSRPPITAAAVATMYNAGQYENPVAVKALEYVKNLLKNARGSTAVMYSGHEYYSMLYTSQAMYLSNEQNWREFFPKCRDDLIAKQNKGNGSWAGDGVGETYGTAIALVVLQLPYKYLPILQR